MTSLNIGAVTPDPKPLWPSTDCPKCGAKKDKRVDVGGFGQTIWCCGVCAYEFKENER